MNYGIVYSSLTTIFILIFCVRTINCDRKSDEYVLTVQSECYTSKKIFSCFKYRIARYVWSFASGKMNLFDYDNTSKEFDNKVRFVQLSEPDNEEMFSESRQMSGDNEINKAMKFIKRAISTFIDGHGVRIGIGTDSGPRILQDNIIETGGVGGNSRGLKKRKWNLIFPLAILVKLLHLKLTLIPIIVGVGLIQLLLIAGGALLFHYLRNNTLCRIQPHLIHSHSHVSETGPEIGGAFGASASYPYGSPTPYNHAGYNKDWATNRAYSAYSFLDAINKN